MNCSIFIRTYDKDFEWLTYCLRSLAKFAHGFSEIVIAVPQGQEVWIRHLTRERIIPVHDAQPGYLGQQVSKLTADLHCKGDFILHCDSDVILTHDVTPQTFMHKGKPRWLITPWDEDMEAKRAWYHVLAKLFCQVSDYEFMRKSTIMIPRFAYKAFRDFIQETRGMTMESWVMNQPGNEFSEFNAMGFYLWLHHRSSIEWHDTTKLGVPPIGERQFWSWGGLKPEIRKEMEAILA